MRGYTKLTDLGNEDCIIMEPRGAYIQETGLPSNWTHVKIGMLYSLVGLAGDNVDGVREAVTYSNFPDMFMFGLTNGTGSVGDVDNRFLGITSNHTTVATWDTNEGALRDTTSLFSTGDGITSGPCSSGTDTMSASTAAASATISFAAFIGIDMYYKGTSWFECKLIYNVPGQSDVSLTNLRNLLVATPTTGTLVSTGVGVGTSSDLTYFFVRMPYLNNRLRIHAIEVMEIS